MFPVNSAKRCPRPDGRRLAASQSKDAHPPRTPRCATWLQVAAGNAPSPGGETEAGRERDLTVLSQDGWPQVPSPPRSGRVSGVFSSSPHVSIPTFLSRKPVEHSVKDVRSTSPVIRCPCGPSPTAPLAETTPSIWPLSCQLLSGALTVRSICPGLPIRTNQHTSARTLSA